MGRIINFFRWLGSLISGPSRLKEEKREEKIEKDIIQSTKKEEKLEKRENKDIKKIIRKLKKVKRQFKSNKVFVEDPKIKNESVNINHSIDLLINRLLPFIKTATPIKQEEAAFKNIKTYWSVVRHTLLNNILTQVIAKEGQDTAKAQLASEEFVEKMKKNAAEIDLLFKKLGIELELEDKISAKKITFVRQEYELMIKERG